MKAREALRVLAEVTESQWGMVTSAQARARGVAPMALSRLAESGDLTRLAHGVYRDSGAPSEEHEDLRAAWLMTDPTKLAYERLGESPRAAVVSGGSASVLLGIGDLRPVKSEFTTPTRKQTQRPEIRYRTRVLPDADVTIRSGLPVTTPERTIADLVENRQDLSTIADVLRDAARQSRLDTDRLVTLLHPLAERNGFGKGDGRSVYDELLRLAGIDLSSLAAQVAAAPQLGELVLSNYAEQMREVNTASLDAVLASATASIEAVLPGEQSERILEILTDAVSASIEPVIYEINKHSERALATSGAAEAVARVAAKAHADMDVTMKAIDWSVLLRSTERPRGITEGQS